MKTISKISLLDVLSNPINRNLILILVATMTFAIAVVTLGIIVYNQW